MQGAADAVAVPVLALLRHRREREVRKADLGRAQRGLGQPEHVDDQRRAARPRRWRLGWKDREGMGQGWRGWLPRAEGGQSATVQGRIGGGVAAAVTEEDVTVAGEHRVLQIVEQWAVVAADRPPRGEAAIRQGPQLRLGHVGQLARAEAQDHAAADLQQAETGATEDDGGERGRRAGAQAVGTAPGKHPAIDGEECLGQSLRLPEGRPGVIKALDQAVQGDMRRAPGIAASPTGGLGRIVGGRAFLGVGDGRQQATATARHRLRIGGAGGQHGLGAGGALDRGSKLPPCGGDGRAGSVDLVHGAPWKRAGRLRHVPDKRARQAGQTSGPTRRAGTTHPGSRTRCSRHPGT